jgi:hypothetical protein
LKGYAQRGWESEREILEGPRVEYVGLVNREGTEEDRVTVAITATLNYIVRDDGGGTVDPADAPVQGDVAISEYWTLARDANGWRAVAIENEEQGAHRLAEPIAAGRRRSRMNVETVSVRPAVVAPDYRHALPMRHDPEKQRGGFVVVSDGAQVRVSFL